LNSLKVEITATCESLRSAVARLNEQEKQALRTPQAVNGGVGQIDRMATQNQRGWATPWERLSGAWNEATARLEMKIANSIGHANTQAKYDRISRHSYRNVIEPARRDEYISERIASDLLQINSIFSSYRPRTGDTPMTAADEVEGLLGSIGNRLPQLDDD
jgi:hypothetical protein